MAESGMSEIGQHQVSVAEVRAVQVGATEVGIRKVEIRQHGTVEVVPGQSVWIVGEGSLTMVQPSTTVSAPARPAVTTPRALTPLPMMTMTTTARSADLPARALILVFT